MAEIIMLLLQIVGEIFRIGALLASIAIAVVVAITIFFAFCIIWFKFIDFLTDFL